MENSKEIQETSPDRLKDKISLIEEFIKEKQKELEQLSKDSLRVDDYSQGIKDAIQKIENHINIQKKEILELRIKQQLNLEAFNFIDGLLESALIVAKKTNLEGEKISLTKRVELANKSAELLKLNSQKSDCESTLYKLLNPAFEGVKQEEKDLKFKKTKKRT